MTAGTQTGLMTAEELFAMPDDGKLYELVRGVLIEVTPSSVRSNAIAIHVAAELLTFVRPRKLGAVGGSEGGFRLATNPDTVRAPDVWFIRAERIPPKGLPDAFWPGAPDLVVEVLSPTDRSGAIADRLSDYFEAGVRLVWLIDPRSEAAAIFRATQPPALLFREGTLDGEEVVPGFRLPLADLFSPFV